MPNTLSTCDALARANEDGYHFSEYALRRWIKEGRIPVRYVGKKALIYYPNLIEFLSCADGGDNQPATVAESPGIRLLEVRP